MSAPPCLLEARRLRVERGGVAVLDVPSFRLHQDELVTVLGPNGCGKSTLLLSMMCLLERAGGEVLYRGVAVASHRAATALRRKVAMVFQEPLLFDASVLDNVASGLRFRGLGRRETGRRAMEYLDRFALAGLASRAARKLSGGEARRVSLARALAVEPEVLLLDEPFTNLDPPTRRSIVDDLERTVRDVGLAAVLVTHDRDEALRLSDRLVVMSGGRVVQSDAPAAVMNDPADAFVAGFLGMETILEGRVARQDGRELTIAVAGRELDAIGEGAPGEQVYCCVRPESVIVDTVDPARTTSARNVFRARVAGVSALGSYLRVKLDCGFPLVTYLTGHSWSSLGLSEGSEVFASFKATATHVIRKREHRSAAAR